MAQVKRETASICKVDDILQGNFVKAEGWSPSYFVTALGNLSRVNILGVVVSREPDGALIFDDGSGRIVLRSFEEGSLNALEIGDFIVVVGRPRMYNEQKYIMPEITRKIDPAWSEYRKKELSFLKRESPPTQKEARRIVEEPILPIANQYQKIMEFIRDLDTEYGAPAEEVAKRTGLSNADELIRKLIAEGEIFELKPGMLKILE